LATTPNLFYNLNILTAFDLCKLQLAVFMYNRQRRNLPPIFDDYFLANATVHDLYYIYFIVCQVKSSFIQTTFDTNAQGFTRA